VSKNVTVIAHGRQKRFVGWKPVLGFIAGTLAVALVAGGSIAAIAAWQLKTKLVENSLYIPADSAPPPNIAAFDGGFNILLVGSDGSDLGRNGSQTVFLSSLVRQIKSDDTLTDLGKLYGIAQAAANNVRLSANFANTDTLVSVALVLKDIPLNHIVFVQYPST